MFDGTLSPLGGDPTVARRRWEERNDAGAPAPKLLFFGCAGWKFCLNSCLKSTPRVWSAQLRTSPSVAGY